MRRRAGFTLIELVVVILILGILAGVAAPKLFNTSGSATDNGLKQTLAVVRNAIDLYASDHTSAFPPCTGTGTDFQTALAPYLRGPFPTSPVGTKDFKIKPITGTTTPDGSTGWMFNTGTGEFICNSSAASVTNGSVTYNQF